MTTTRKTRTPAEQRKVAADDVHHALRNIEDARREAAYLRHRLEKVVDDLDRAIQTARDGLSWLEMEPDAIAAEIARNPEDFPPIA